MRAVKKFNLIFWLMCWATLGVSSALAPVHAANDAPEGCQKLLSMRGDTKRSGNMNGLLFYCNTKSDTKLQVSFLSGPLRTVILRPADWGRYQRAILRTARQLEKVKNGSLSVCHHPVSVELELSGSHLSLQVCERDKKFVHVRILRDVLRDLYRSVP